MATKRRHASDTLDEAPALGDSLIPPEVYVIGPASAPMTPGWLMGIGSRPETAEEHATRIGSATGTFADAGHLTGTIKGYTAAQYAPRISSFDPDPISVATGSGLATVYGEFLDETCTVKVGAVSGSGYTAVSAGELRFTFNSSTLTAGTPVSVVVTKGSLASRPYMVPVVA